MSSNPRYASQDAEIDSDPIPVATPPGGSAEDAERKRQRVRLARLEADMAYFQARLELIGVPRSNNRAAQRKVFNLLHKAVASKILKVKRRYSELG